MDDEDLADAAEAQKLHTSQTFAGLGSSEQQPPPQAVLGLFRAEGNTMGLQLLRRMGWKDGQGIGPKIRRSARLGLDGGAAPSDGETFLFAPEDTLMIQIERKSDRRGLGHRAEGGLQALGRQRGPDDDDSDDGVAGKETDGNRGRSKMSGFTRGKTKPTRGAFGVGVLNDSGSEEDPYEMGPKIKYNRSIGGSKKKKGKKTVSSTANPAVANAPKFIPKFARASGGPRRCHDGRLPLAGFDFGKMTEDFGAALAQYAPPPVPAGWKSAKSATTTSADGAQYVSTADAAKTSKLNPTSRAALLGEAPLPGKSVFDYLSESARDKLVAASGRSDLPRAGGEAPVQEVMAGEERQRWLWDQVPKLDRETATAALARASGGPYAEDEGKRMRYRRYLEHQLNARLPLPSKLDSMDEQGYLREMGEFKNCARIFKPMTGFMASRFTTSKGPSAKESEAKAAESKPADAAEEAARMGMFGRLTRTEEDFYPTRLLCKRFNVKAPPHARPDNEPEEATKTGATSATAGWEASMADARPASTPVAPGMGGPGPSREPEAVEIDADTNETLEKGTANADVLRAIFGDGDSD